MFEANFIKSASKISQSPEDDSLEIAFMGRSNVGKSSLINSVLNRKGLAKSSNTPGKTQLINFFGVKFRDRDSSDTINFRIVDLPGIGYARVSKTIKEDWEDRLNTFISKRENISIFLYLIDSRHPTLDIDRGVIEYLQTILSPEQRIIKVFTKIDKLKKSEIHKLKAKNRDEVFISNLKGVGVKEFQDKLFSIIKSSETVDS